MIISPANHCAFSLKTHQLLFFWSQSVPSLGLWDMQGAKTEHLSPWFCMSILYLVGSWLGKEVNHICATNCTKCSYDPSGHLRPVNLNWTHWGPVTSWRRIRRPHRLAWDKSNQVCYESNKITSRELFLWTTSGVYTELKWILSKVFINI